MNIVLGFTLLEATAVLERAGFRVIAQEVRSRKGQPGNEDRVVRQKALPVEDGRQPEVLLTYARFQTEVGE